MQVIRRSWLRGPVAALALLLAAGAHAQAKLPRAAASAPSGLTAMSGTGLRPSIQVAPATAEPAPAPAAAPAAAASAAAQAAATSEQEALASAAAAGWLTLLDRRDWGRAWETSASMFRNAVPLDKWMDGIPKVRGDVGTMVERTPSNVVSKTELPGKPKGEYVTVLFVTRFDNRAVEEVVTTVHEPDGRWRVAGYSAR
ncbi:DUF4019 domain-containing protein [Ramlibacter algicola]|uniref:DUF4019 domain-containing protein n=1 Tax=Ramlibacter algicola TaxID=2795217 RepID=A0A934Q0K0_9BURK|nr:DUF4019 domain-containing protein [Ramlibacter algicola]MBK0393995.1 DUF4019 domain-containing protein [Ramlibacter algicola]